MRIVLLIPLLFLALFFFYPLGAIISRSQLLSAGGRFDASYLTRLLWFTTWQAGVSTLLTLAVGLPGAHVLARYRFRGRSLLRALTTIPFVMPALIVAAAFLSLIGPRGALNLVLMRLLRLDSPPIRLQHTIWIVLLAHVFYNYSVVIRVVGSLWEQLDPHLEEAAQVLGADRRRTWLEVTLPQLAPAVAAAALLVFAFCFTSFGVMMVLGGPRLATLEVEIYRQAVHMLNLPLAAALSVVQMAFTFALMSAYAALQRRTSRPLAYRSAAAAQRLPRSAGERIWVAANVALMVILLLAPLAALVWRSFTVEGRPTLRNYVALAINSRRSYFFISPATAVRNSLLFATAATLLSLTLGLLGAYLVAGHNAGSRRWRAWLDPLFLLPLGTSSVTLGFGYLIAFGRPPLNLITSPLLVPVAHALIAFPFVVRALLPALRSIRPTLREAAATLGAVPWRVWLEVDLPLLRRALAVGAVYAFTISIGEFGATLLIARAEYATIPVVIYRSLSQPGAANVGQAMAMSTLLMAICTVAFVIIG